ncbi:GNAT family N-acetyltransferase [Ramlibacter sp. AW1]|uniref:GNAT family N-acetyltransferase n=1 Tax=Ramlibacter aurantiacus TaxID=2801330 RepID=A0A936ZUC7_9BURK|nr:GNAT family N-acetyltransferase [Ramlibacter aurantiacus]MBL0422726.1 GNAT family N-acetyltransferase [Ramlibacter aurantiacus]
MSTKISVIHAAQIDRAMQARWLALQEANPALASPYFCPEFTRQVARVRPDVRVAVIEDADGVQGFFPYQGRWGMGRPVGAPLSDHHGVVCAPDLSIDWPRLLQATGLSFWEFDHLPRAQAPTPGLRPSESPGLDLSRGFTAYKRSRIESGARRIAELDRKARKMAREVGPLRFEPHSADRAVFDAVLELKSQQCRRTGVPDFFARGWTRELVESIWKTEHPGFAGRLSALYAGDTLVAAHLGMRSRTVWHWWFPVYEHAQARHSPGAQMLMAVAQAAAAEGCGLLDLGKGEDAYKHSFADCASPLVEGWVSRPALATALHGARGATMNWLRSSRALQPLKPLVRRIRRRAV